MPNTLETDYLHPELSTKKRGTTVNQLHENNTFMSRSEVSLVGCVQLWVDVSSSVMK